MPAQQASPLDTAVTRPFGRAPTARPERPSGPEVHVDGAGGGAVHGDLRAPGHEVRDGDPDRDAVGGRRGDGRGRRGPPSRRSGRRPPRVVKPVAGRHRARRSGAGAPARDERPDEVGRPSTDPLRRRPEVQVRDVRVGGDDAQPAGLQHQTGQVLGRVLVRPVALALGGRGHRRAGAARRGSPCSPGWRWPAACPPIRRARGPGTPRRASRRPARWRARCHPRRTRRARREAERLR